MAHVPYYFEMARKIRPLKVAPKAWNYVKYRALTRSAVTSVQRYTPQIGSLLVTMRCNLNCGYCSVVHLMAAGQKNWRESEANLAKAQRIFTHPLFANCLLIDLLGGEPLLVDDLDRIIAFLTARGHITNTSTNGLLLAERITDLKQAGISRINVSLYEANRAIMERDLARINRIFPVHTSWVLQRSMVEQQPEKLIATARFIKSAGSLSLRYFMYRPVGANPQPGEIITDTDPAYLAFRQQMEQALPGFCVWPAAIHTQNVKKLCPQLWQRVNCDATGQLGICCGTDTTLSGPNSNLFDAAPDVVFNHPTLVEMRRQLLDPVSAPPAVCRNCNLLGDPGW